MSADPVCVSPWRQRESLRQWESLAAAGKPGGSGKAWRQRESLVITGKPGVPERKRGRDADSSHERIDQDLI